MDTGPTDVEGLGGLLNNIDELEALKRCWTKLSPEQQTCFHRAATQSTISSSHVAFEHNVNYVKFLLKQIMDAGVPSPSSAVRGDIMFSPKKRALANAEDAKLHATRGGELPRKRFRKLRQKPQKRSKKIVGKMKNDIKQSEDSSIERGERDTQAKKPSIHHRHRKIRHYRIRGPRGSNSRSSWSEGACPEHCFDTLFAISLSRVPEPARSPPQAIDSDESDSESGEQHIGTPPPNPDDLSDPPGESGTDSDSGEEKVLYVVNAHKATSVEEVNAVNVSSQIAEEDQIWNTGESTIVILSYPEFSHNNSNAVPTKVYSEAEFSPSERDIESLATNFVDILSKEHHLSMRRTSQKSFSKPCQHRDSIVEYWMSLNVQLVKLMNVLKKVQALQRHLHGLEDYPKLSKTEQFDPTISDKAQDLELRAKCEELRTDLERVEAHIKCAESTLESHDVSCARCLHVEDQCIPSNFERSDIARKLPERKRHEQYSYDMNELTFGSQAVSEFYNSSRRESTGVLDDFFHLKKYNATPINSARRSHNPSSSECDLGLHAFTHVTDTVGQRLKEELPPVECHQGKDTWDECPIGLHSLTHDYDSIARHLKNELPCIEREHGLTYDNRTTVNEPFFDQLEEVRHFNKEPAISQYVNSPEVPPNLGLQGFPDTLIHFAYLKDTDLAKIPDHTQEPPAYEPDVMNLNAKHTTPAGIPSYNHAAWDLWFKDARYLDLKHADTEAKLLRTTKSSVASISDYTQKMSKLNCEMRSLDVASVDDLEMKRHHAVASKATNSEVARLSDHTEDIAELDPQIERLVQECTVSIKSLETRLGAQHEAFLDPFEMRNAIQKCIASVNKLEKRLHAESMASMEMRLHDHANADMSKRDSSYPKYLKPRPGTIGVKPLESKNYHLQFLHPHRIGGRFMGSDADLEDMMKWEKGKFAEESEPLKKPIQQDLELRTMFESEEAVHLSKLDSNNIILTVKGVPPSMRSSTDSAEDRLFTDAAVEQHDSAIPVGTKGSIENTSRSFELARYTWSKNYLSDIDEDTTEISDSRPKPELIVLDPPSVFFKEATYVAETPQKADRAVTFDLSPIDPASRVPANTPVSDFGSTLNTPTPNARAIFTTPEKMSRRSFGSMRRFMSSPLFTLGSADNSPGKEVSESTSCAVESEHGSPSPSPITRGLRGSLRSLRGLIVTPFGRRHPKSKARPHIKDVDYEADTESDQDGGPLRRVSREPGETAGC